MHYVYILLSRKDKQLYVGLTRDIKRRLKEHLSGKVTATRDRRPLILVLYEAFKNRGDAVKREYYLKTGWGRTHLKKTLKQTLSEMSKN